MTATALLLFGHVRLLNWNISARELGLERPFILLHDRRKWNRNFNMNTYYTYFFYLMNCYICVKRTTITNISNNSFTLERKQMSSSESHWHDCRSRWAYCFCVTGIGTSTYDIFIYFYAKTYCQLHNWHWPCQLIITIIATMINRLGCKRQDV